jgi:hypothetical protein
VGEAGGVVEMFQWPCILSTGPEFVILLSGSQGSSKNRVEELCGNEFYNLGC